MDVEEVVYDGNSKFMWDGETYETQEDAQKKQKEYEENKFEVKLIEKGGKHFVYTRRVVTEIVLEGPPPA